MRVCMAHRSCQQAQSEIQKDDWWLDAAAVLVLFYAARCKWCRACMAAAPTSATETGAYRSEISNAGDSRGRTISTSLHPDQTCLVLSESQRKERAYRPALRGRHAKKKSLRTGQGPRDQHEELGRSQVRSGWDSWSTGFPGSTGFMGAHALRVRWQRDV